MIKVLVIDDSFVMRKLLSDILSSDDIEVAGTARSGNEALKKIPLIKPDVITLDLVMPGWSGLTTLKHIMEEYPAPVIILSAHSREGADITIECLEAGAVGFVLKPSGELSLDIETVREKLILEIKAAAGVNVQKLKAGRVTSGEIRSAKYERRKTKNERQIVVIGASTGGHQTLTPILSSLPLNFSTPVIIVQHMPCIEFTRSMAERVKRFCRLNVKVAEDNEIIERKKVYLVPGGYSMTLRTKDEGRGTVVMRLVKDEPGALTPSINTTMKSAAGIYKENVIGVILTGMGNDGADGMEAIKKSGGKTLVQDESALIFGMPKAVIDRGCADSVLPAGKMAEGIIYSVERRGGA